MTSHLTSDMSSGVNYHFLISTKNGQKMDKKCTKNGQKIVPGTDSANLPKVCIFPKTLTFQGPGGDLKTITTDNNKKVV